MPEEGYYRITYTCRDPAASGEVCLLPRDDLVCQKLEGQLFFLSSPFPSSVDMQSC